MKKEYRLKSAGPVEKLLSLLFPARCLLCGKTVSAGESLCESCEREAPKEPCQRRYSLPGAGAAGFRIVSPMPYRGGFRKALYRYKFRNKRALAKPLGQLMARVLPEPANRFDAVAWVPMTEQKKRERGYDQSELLAREAAKALGLPCLPLLKKARETKTQHELSRKERMKNVKNAYQASREAEGKALLLVDDIVTTGSTLRECAEALYRAGAVRVFGLCAADAPEITTEERTKL